VQRLLWLMVAAGALVWAGALLDLGGPHRGPRGASSSQADDATGAPDEHTSTPARERPATPAGEEAAPSPSAPTASARAKAAPGSAQPPRPGQGDVHVIGSAQAAQAAPGTAVRAEQGTEAAAEDALRGELGEGLLSPEYVEIEQGYVNEPRDGDWAMVEEQRVRAVLGNSAVAEQVALVHCQETVCKVVLQTDTPEAFERLLKVPGISAATGIDRSTPYSLRGGQLSVYFRGRREDNKAAVK
jgi:hypothetical protein